MIWACGFSGAIRHKYCLPLASVSKHQSKVESPDYCMYVGSNTDSTTYPTSVVHRAVLEVAGSACTSLSVTRSLTGGA
jgi:hypothetical protein